MGGDPSVVNNSVGTHYPHNEHNRQKRQPKQVEKITANDKQRQENHDDGRQKMGAFGPEHVMLLLCHGHP